MSDPVCPCGASQEPQGPLKKRVKAKSAQGRLKRQTPSDFRLYDQCCGLFHRGAIAPTAELLMRSRYSAFVVKDAGYLLASWHPRTRPETINFDPSQRWLGLKIVSTVDGQPDDEHGIVAFVARYKIAGRGLRLSETSHFERVGERWYYVEGQQLSTS